jgi:hypothetical protein
MAKFGSERWYAKAEALYVEVERLVAQREDILAPLQGFHDLWEEARKYIAELERLNAVLELQLKDRRGGKGLMERVGHTAALVGLVGASLSIPVNGVTAYKDVWDMSHHAEAVAMTCNVTVKLPPMAPPFTVRLEGKVEPVPAEELPASVTLTLDVEPPASASVTLGLVDSSEGPVPAAAVAGSAPRGGELPVSAAITLDKPIEAVGTVHTPTVGGDARPSEDP